MESNSTTHKNILMFEPLRFDIAWFNNILDTGNGILNVAICQNTNQVAFIDPNPLKTLIVRDVWLENGECIDSNFCLCTSCKFNNNTYEKYTTAIKAKTGEISPELFKQMVKLAKKVTDELKLHFEFKYGSIQYFEKPFMGGNR